MSDNVQVLREKAVGARNLIEDPILNEALAKAKELVMAEMVLNRTPDARKLELVQLYKAIELLKPMLQTIINDYQSAARRQARG
jgi:hypothetical protein